MTVNDDRDQAETAKFAHDAEAQFRVLVRRNKLLGHWAAERMDLDAAETESYARSVVQAEFEESGDEDVVRKVLGDLLQGGIDASEGEVRGALSQAAVTARRQLMGQV